MQAELLEHIALMDLTILSHSTPVVAVYLPFYTSYIFPTSLMSSSVGISSVLPEFAHLSYLYLDGHVSL